MRQIKVLRAGLCDLVMDQGRPGWAALGVPAGGASDLAALAMANRLVGNDVTAAGLELALVGPLLKFPQGGVVALTGSPFSAKREGGAPIHWNETLLLAPGEILDMGRAEAGCRCWLAVSGGLSVPPVMASRSTFLPGGWGGFEGRPLRAGDVLPLGSALEESVPRMRAGTRHDAPAGLLRVIAGPQRAGFEAVGLAAFFSSRYRVSPRSDRRGFRLEGHPVRCAEPEMASQGVLPGAVQVPPDGQPIILGWDGPVTGGYPVIATVVDADLRRLAQLRPGDEVGFATIETIVARELARQHWNMERMT